MNRRNRIRRGVVGLAVAAAVAGGTVVAAIGGATTADAAVTPAAARTALAAGPALVAKAPTCPVVSWGSLAKGAGGTTTAPIVGVRTGRHGCFDRVVVDLGAGPGAVGYSVKYVAALYQEGSGKVVPLRGGARLEIVVHAPAYNVNTGTPTFRPARPTELSGLSGYSTLRQVAYAGSFEGQTTIGVGVRARLPFRVLLLAGPGGGHRLVVDVAHHW